MSLLLEDRRTTLCTMSRIFVGAVLLRTTFHSDRWGVVSRLGDVWARCKAEELGIFIVTRRRGAS